MRFQALRRAGFSTLLVGALILAVGCQPGNPDNQIGVKNDAPPMESSHPQTPQYPPAPDFTLTSATGEKFQLSQLKGKHPVLVNFFATW